MGITIFFLITLGGPAAYWYITIPSTCTDGIQNQNETAVDRGGLCPYLDEDALSPYAILWARSFRVRDGFYNATAYIQNPNPEAGVRRVAYRFGLYDARNVLIAEREGTTYIEPMGVTPVIESHIDAGSRIVSRTYFELIEPLLWERFKNPANSILIRSKDVSNIDSNPRLSAVAENSSVVRIDEPSFTAVLFDSAGNAFASSETRLNQIGAGESVTIVFTWPDSFPTQPAKIDVIPLLPPVPLTVRE